MTLNEAKLLDFAKTCVHCTDTVDSFNRYVSTYCHEREENIYGLGNNELDRCKTCEFYERNPLALAVGSIKPDQTTAGAATRADKQGGTKC